MARIEFYAQAALLKQQLTTGGNRTKIQRRTNREATQSDHVNHTQSRAVLRIIQVTPNQRFSSFHSPGTPPLMPFAISSSTVQALIVSGRLPVVMNFQISDCGSARRR